MGEWKEYRLEEVIEKFIDYRGKTPKKTFSGVPLITAKIVKNGKILPPNEFIAVEDYADWMTRGLPKVNDVVLTTEAPLGEVALLKEEYVALAQRIILLRGKKDIVYNPFLLYYLQAPEGQYALQSRASGTTVFGIKAAILREMVILLPSLKEQKTIADTLSSLDDKIDLLNRQNATLEKMAETLFRQWFIEDAKEDWKEGKLGDIIIPKKGKNINKEQAIPGDYPVIAGGLSPSCFHNQYNTLEPVITISASGANAGYVCLHYNKVWASDSSFIDYSITKFIYFFYVYLKINQKIITDKQEGSAQPHIYPSHLMDLDLLKYPVDLINKFENDVTPFFQKIENNHNQIRTLTRLRDTLLPKLMNGEITVK